MHKQIGSYEAKSKLPEILRRVEEGQAFTITNRGRSVADLVPSKEQNKAKTKMAISNLLKSKKHKISDSKLSDLKESGRK